MTTDAPTSGFKTVDIVKWIATATQLVGYGLTGLNAVRWDVFTFFAGIFLWFSAVSSGRTRRSWSWMSAASFHFSWDA